MTDAYTAMSLCQILKTRTGWLALFLAGLMACAAVMHHFHAILSDNLELAYFVPLLIGHAGNSGGQAITTIVRELGRDTLRRGHMGPVVLREGMIGTAQSVLLAACLLVYMHFVRISHPVMVTVTVTMILLGAFSNASGTFFAFVFHRVGCDPAVIVGPLMTTTIDTFGIFVYLSIATLVMPGGGER